MQPGDRSPWPQRTTLMAGGLLAASGLLQLVTSMRMSIPVAETLVVPLGGPVILTLAAGTRAAGFVVAATGVHGELGFTGRSGWGKAALVVWGVRDLALFILGTLAPSSGGSSELSIDTNAALQALFVVAAGIGAASVARTRVLVGWVRWALLPLAALEAVAGLLFASPALQSSTGLALLLVLAAWPTQLFEPVLTLAIAVSLITWGRLEAVRHRARVIHDAW